MTRTHTDRCQRPSKKHRYRPQVVSLRELREIRSKPKDKPPRRIYVQSPYFEQMECGSKKVEARPNYPCLRDLVPGTVVEFSNRFSGRSFLATITSRRVHRDFVNMLRAETIKDCLPDRDPYDLQRAVNVYHSFRHETYKYIVKQHGVVSLRFEHVEPLKPKRSPRTYDSSSDYKRNSLCAIFEYRNPKFENIKRRLRERLNNPIQWLFYLYFILEYLLESRTDWNRYLIEVDVCYLIILLLLWKNTTNV